MNLKWLAKLRDLVTALEKLRRPSDYAYGQRGRNENGRLGHHITAPGKDPDSPRLIFPHEEV